VMGVGVCGCKRSENATKWREPFVEDEQTCAGKRAEGRRAAWAQRSARRCARLVRGARTGRRDYVKPGLCAESNQPTILHYCMRGRIVRCMKGNARPDNIRLLLSVHQ